MMRSVNRLNAQTPAEGALATLYAAVADIPGGTFVGPGGLMQVRGAPKPVQPSRAARDPEVARRLWDASAELTNVHTALTFD